ncbi:hypothetical protein HPB51_027409 [Rhipicephalus microplus]|uniref:ABC-2 type transporter transmembrane domain-containing protein n=1 Tax=Rhipicephalus microplus TaxID=6941 RepID=A0A9J6D0M8_RHIMP|nr:hypothetical protein HPB51_027409 [Rhipicephalus microplus]
METTGCWSQLGLVMWRQVWLTRVRRHYLVTLLELTCMVFMLSSVWEESVAPYRARPNKDQFFDSADAIEFWGRPNESWNEGTLAFAPDQAFFADLTARVCKELGSKWTPMPFKDAHEAAQYVEDGASSETAGQEQLRRVAVWFERPETDRLTYHVRIRNAVFDLRDDYKRSLLVPGAADIDLQDEIRLLLPLQYFVESAYIQMIAESLQKPINVKLVTVILTPFRTQALPALQNPPYPTMCHANRAATRNFEAPRCCRNSNPSLHMTSSRPSMISSTDAVPSETVKLKQCSLSGSATGLDTILAGPGRGRRRWNQASKNWLAKSRVDTRQQRRRNADRVEDWNAEAPYSGTRSSVVAVVVVRNKYNILTSKVVPVRKFFWLLLPLQYFVESAYIQMIAESLQKPINVKVELMRFPYPRLFYGSEDHTLSLVSLRFAISFFVPFCLLVVKLVKEKRVGAKEMLRRAGLSDVAYWMGHFFESGFVVLCAVLLMYVPLFVIPNGNGTAFIEFANPVVIMAVLLLFGVLTILHAMLLSVFLWGPGVAFAAAVVYWFALGLLPYAQLQNPFGLGYYLISRSTKLISALSPVMYLHWCLRAIERFEKYEVRLTWRNIFDSGTTLDNVSVGELCLLSLSASLVLVGLIWYLDNVVPWGYGVPKPFYFIFSTDYWSPYRKWNIRNMNYAQDKSYFEADPKNADAIVHLIDLSATNKPTGDIKNIILTIYNKQITVILGPQDCGHVTLLDIITGHQPISRGPPRNWRLTYPADETSSIQRPSQIPGNLPKPIALWAGSNKTPLRVTPLLTKAPAVPLPNLTFLAKRHDEAPG